MAGRTPDAGCGGMADAVEHQFDDRGTDRTVYTVYFETAVCVLHAVMRKSKQGIKTP
ncbi:hypothetical protein [Methylobacterium sp. Gmos1]